MKKKDDVSINIVLTGDDKDELPTTAQASWVVCLDSDPSMKKSGVVNFSITGTDTLNDVLTAVSGAVTTAAGL